MSLVYWEYTLEACIRFSQFGEGEEETEEVRNNAHNRATARIFSSPASYDTDTRSRRLVRAHESTMPVLCRACLKSGVPGTGRSVHASRFTYITHDAVGRVTIHQKNRKG